jgi:Acetyltransferases, including N-acetylases of ribosomal proteins
MGLTETHNNFMEWDDIVLRPVEKEDAEFIAETISHGEVRAYLGRAPRPVNKRQEEYIEEFSSNGDSVHFLIEYQGEKVGHIFLGDLESDYGRSGVGYFIHPEYHGQGIGTKSLKMVVSYAFETLNRHKIRGGHLEGNPASRRVMEKAGFQEEGTERHYKYVDGEWKDVVWMGIIEDEYYN